MNLAGVVILYNPDDGIIDNIMSYAPFLEHLFIFDNSPSSHETIKHKIEKVTNVHFFWDGDNKGLPVCLNKALELARNIGCRWLLSMDQDSRFNPNGLKDYISCIPSLPENAYGISATYQNEIKGNKLPSQRLTVVQTCITSGNIINVPIAILCGGFDENLFIDEVDSEFCYRCNKAGYTLYKYNKIVFTHHLGNPIHKNILGFHYTAVNESYFRQYYIIRNRLYVASKYPEIKPQYYLNIISGLQK